MLGKRSAQRLDVRAAFSRIIAQLLQPGKTAPQPVWRRSRPAPGKSQGIFVVSDHRVAAPVSSGVSELDRRF